MIPVYLQLNRLRTLRGFVAEEARGSEVAEQFCLGQNFRRVTVNRGERCWVIAVIEMVD